MNIRRKLLQKQNFREQMGTSSNVLLLYFGMDNGLYQRYICHCSIALYAFFNLSNDGAQQHKCAHTYFQSYGVVLLYGAHYYGNFPVCIHQSCQCSTLYSRFLHLFVSLLSRQVFRKAGYSMVFFVLVLAV